MTSDAAARWNYRAKHAPHDLCGGRRDPRHATAIGLRLTRHPPGHVRRVYDGDEIEALSLSRIRGQRANPAHHYWATTEETAAELRVTRSAVRQMMLADRLPYVTARNGRRYVRGTSSRSAPMHASDAVNRKAAGEGDLVWRALELAEQLTSANAVLSIAVG
jgi:hypothetical protein